MTDPSDSDAPWTPITRTRWEETTATTAPDAVAREEPLEIRFAGVALAVVMRTPGHDEDLARGFLLTERIVEAPADIASVRHCDTLTDPRAENNVILAVPRGELAIDLSRHRRNFYASSSCGVCGKASLEQAMAIAEPIASSPTIEVAPAILYSLPELLERHQPVFAKTGGLHGVALVSRAGQVQVAREDVGRHNAVDKVIGWAAKAGLVPLASSILIVSGRVSFEVVQKALAARIPIVAGVSAPSSLAIELAAAAHMTLVGFLRDRSMRVYAGGERIANAPA